jgi:hypothetical protein
MISAAKAETPSSAACGSWRWIITVDAGYQYDVWNYDSQKSICFATAPLEVLEKVP